jgi:hypothetical protein
MATIKEILQNFCYRINVPAPTSFVGVASPAEQQYLSLLKFIGDDLRNRPYNWPQLKRGYTFTTQTDVRKYQLPGDFYRLLESAQWDVTNQWPMRGPISDYNFNVRDFAVVSLQTRKAFRIIGAQNYIHATSPFTQTSGGWFEIDPAGQNNTDEMFMGYMSRNWLWPQNWVTNTVYTGGAIRTGVGYVYRTAAGGTSGATRPSHATGSESDGTVTWTVYTEPYDLISNSNLNDNDIVLFDDDLMIEGMRWAYLRAKGMDYQQERVDWDNMVKGAYSRFNGPTRINVGSIFDDFGDWPNIPNGSYNV